MIIVESSRKLRDLLRRPKKKNILAHISRLLRPDKRLPQLDRHPLLGLWSSPGAKVPAIAGDPRDGLLLDVAAHADDAYAVRSFEVVAQVEFVQVEGDTELGVAGGEEGGSDEGDCEFGAVDSSRQG